MLLYFLEQSPTDSLERRAVNDSLFISSAFEHHGVKSGKLTPRQSSKQLHVLGRQTPGRSAGVRDQLGTKWPMSTQHTSYTNRLLRERRCLEWLAPYKSAKRVLSLESRWRFAIRGSGHDLAPPSSLAAMAQTG